MCLDTLLVLTAAKNQHKNVLGFGVVFFVMNGLILCF